MGLLAQRTDEPAVMHRCTDCGKKRPWTREHYYWRIKSKKRLQSRCKGCYVSQSIADARKHSERTQRNREHWRGTDACKAGIRRWRAEHMEHIRRYDRDRWRQGSSKTTRLQRDYGLTLAALEALLEKQKGVCAICGKTRVHARAVHLRGLQIDHDHVAGRVRGLLCHLCNKGLGLFEDDPAVLVRAASYLKEHKACSVQ